MANARVKRVANELADVWTRGKYLQDYLTDLREPLGNGDVIEVPDISQLTVSQASSSGTAQDVTNQAVAPNVTSLTANREPAIFLEVMANQDIQVMDGRYFSQVAVQATSQLKNSVDNTVSDDLAFTTCYDTSATYHDNPDGSSLTAAKIASAKAGIEALDGAHNPVLFLGAFGLASMLSVAGFIPNFTEAQAGNLGIPRIGSVFGIPVFMSNSVNVLPTVAATASAISSNVLTLTVAAGHGLVPGLMIKTSGATANVTTAAAITSVTATTVVVPKTASNDATNGAATITEQSSWNLLVDLPHNYIAKQRGPFIRQVPYYNRTSDSLQISLLYGVAYRVGRTRVLHSPPTSA